MERISEFVSPFRGSHCLTVFLHFQGSWRRVHGGAASWFGTAESIEFAYWNFNEVWWEKGICIYIYKYAYIHICMLLPTFISLYTYTYIYIWNICISIFVYLWFSETVTDLRKVRKMNQPGFHGMKLKGLFRLQLLNRWGSHTANQMNKKRTWKESPSRQKSKEMHGHTHANHQLYSILGVPLCSISLFAFVLVFARVYVSITAFLRLNLQPPSATSLPVKIWFKECHECRLAFLGQRGLYLRMANLCQLQYAICVLHRCGKSRLQSSIESDQ